MKRESRLLLKTCLIMIGLFFLCFLLGRHEENRKSSPEKVIAKEEVIRFMTALFPDKKDEFLMFSDWEKEEEPVLYEEFEELMKKAGLEEEQYSCYRETYRKGKQLKRLDWYRFYDSLLEHYNTDGKICKEELYVLALPEDICQEDGKESSAAGKAELMTSHGKYTYPYVKCNIDRYQCIVVYSKNQEILSVVEETDGEYTFKNVWMIGQQGDEILCFYDNTEFRLHCDLNEESGEQLIDLTCQSGKAEYLVKNEKISGKLLARNEKEIELQGTGKLQLTDEIKIYQLYGTIAELTLQNLPVGNETTDYILEQGKVCGMLVTADKKMEKIRVLIRTGNYESIFHERIEFQSDTSYLVICDNGQSETYEAGQNTEIKRDSACFLNGDRIRIVPASNTGRIRLCNIERATGHPFYRGSMEIKKTEEGLILINELFLEEYLYAVVPSEMPASYPSEALQAQAVCARTYAYGNMEKTALPEYGAHVDDSTAFQVYQNSGEQPAATAAVKATKGVVLTYAGVPIEAYYYSTSCGFGTDESAWQTEKEDEDVIPYLQSEWIGTGTEEKEDFEGYLKSKPEDAFEREEPWFRWEYTIAELDTEGLRKRLEARWESRPEQVLTKQKDGTYESMEIGATGAMKDIHIESRTQGGCVAQLLLIFEKKTIKVLTEYNIRAVLADKAASVRRQDGSMQQATLLPSGFFTLETVKDKDSMLGYTIYGGGYGHGIGMSQNGARNMAASGMKSEEILSFFYHDTQEETIY